MSTFVYKDLKLWLDGYDVSGDHNEGSLTWTATALPTTVFGLDSETFKAGLKSMTFNLGGFQSEDTTEIGGLLFPDVGGAARNVLWSPDGGEAGERAYLTKDLLLSYTPLQGSVGDMATFSVSGQGTGDLAVGLMLEAGATARESTFDGTGYEVGAVAAGETLYGGLHVVAASGTSPTLDVIVQSDTDVNFGSPTTRLTFTQAAAVGAEWKSAAGAITDTFYRVNVTIGGTTPSFTFAVGVGIA